MKITVTFDIEVDEVRHSYEQIEEWVRFELKDGCEIKADNPLCSKELIPVPYSLILNGPW